ARSLTGLSQQELAARASISRPCLTAWLTAWEGSSGSVPNAKARALHRAVSALEAEGDRFSDGGGASCLPKPRSRLLNARPQSTKKFFNLRECGYLCHRRAPFFVLAVLFSVFGNKAVRERVTAGAY